MLDRDTIGWAPSDYDFLIETSERSHLRADHLLACMAAESELDSRAENMDTKAQGLTQIMAFVLANLGWLPGRPEYEMVHGSYREAPVRIQILYAGRYFDDWRRRFGLGRWDSRVQLYLANILPAKIPIAKTDDTAVLEKVRWPAGYKVNAGLDRNHDGRITVAELDFFVEDATVRRARSQYAVACRGLNEAFRRHGEYAPAPIETTPMPPALRDVRDVRSVQLALVELGYNPGALDGVYGPKTRNAVRDYQKAKGLSVDGWIGPFTLASLSDALSQRQAA